MASPETPRPWTIQRDVRWNETEEVTLVFQADGTVTWEGHKITQGPTTAYCGALAGQLTSG